DSFDSVVITTVPSNGVLYVDSNGNGVVDGGEAVSTSQSIALAEITAGRLKFKPASDANGAAYDSFTFQVRDDGGTANGGVNLDVTPNTMTIDVTPVNDEPAGTDATVTLLEDTDYTFATSDFGFSDTLDGDALDAVVIGTLPMNGTLFIDANGNGVVDGGEAVTVSQTITVADITAGRLKFKPAVNANGLTYDSFTFQVRDDGGTANGGINTDATPNTITIDVTPVNDEPTGTNNTVTTFEDSDYTFATIDFGFSDVVEGDGFNAVVVSTLPSNGALYLDMNGNGVVDGGETVTVAQTISVADIASGRFKFKPTANANGPGYDSFTFQVQDDGGTANGGVDTDLAPNTMTIDVTPVNDEPAGADNTVTTLEDNDYAFITGDFGFTDTIDGDSFDAVVISTLPSNGTLYLDINGDGLIDGGEAVTVTQAITVADISAGRLKFKPVPDAVGIGYDSFTFQVRDDGGTPNGGADTDVTPNTMTINVTPVNDSDPVANDDSITVAEGGTATVLDSAANSVLANDSDDDLPFDTLTVSIASGPAYASSFALNPDGTFSYTHDGTENFTDSFTYIVSDANGGVTDTGTVTIVMNPVNDNDPIANNDSITLNEGATATVLDSAATSVLANDTDIDLPNDSLTVTVGSGPSFASSFVLNADGTFSYTHNGTENFVDSFTYIVSDANGGLTDTGTVSITINPINDNDPVASNDSITVNEGGTAFILDSTATSVLANDTDIDLPNDALTVTLDTGPSFANSFTLNADGTFSYTHDDSENLTDSFTYIVSDANGGVTDTGTVTINVNPVNDNDPVAANDSISLANGATMMTLDSGASSVLANDTDLDLPNDTLTVTLLSGPSAASSFVLNADGTFVYAHDGGSATNDSFVYQVMDADGGVADTAIVNINISSSNIAPVITSNSGGASAFVALANNQSVVTTVTATDVDGDDVRYALSGADAANFSIDPVSGVLTLLDTSVAATYSIDVLASDPSGAMDMQRLTISAPGTPDVVLPPPIDPPPVPDTPDDFDEPTSTFKPVSTPDTVSEPTTEEPTSREQAADIELIRVQKVALADFSHQQSAYRFADYGDSGRYNDDDRQQKPEIVENSWDRNALLNSMALEIDLATAEMIERVDQATYLEVNVRRTAEMVSLVAIAGLMNILLKGTGLLGAAVTAMPLWRWMDPMPILNAEDDDRRRFEQARDKGDQYEQRIDGMLHGEEPEDRPAV
ncbi:MAG: Ig-like domain-containing protein, partial [Pseudomonadota bacterium]